MVKTRTYWQYFRFMKTLKCDGAGIVPERAL